MAFRWRADDGPFIAVLGSSSPYSTKKNAIKFGPPLTKLSGSAHVYRLLLILTNTSYENLVCEQQLLGLDFATLPSRRWSRML